MTNTTLGGPSYGLLDVIFGNVPKAEESKEGKEFEPLLELVRSLDKKINDETEQADSSWTDMGTAPGMNSRDSRNSIIPGMPSVAAIGAEKNIDVEKQMMLLPAMKKAVEILATKEKLVSENEKKQGDPVRDSAQMAMLFAMTGKQIQPTSNDLKMVESEITTKEKPIVEGKSVPKGIEKFPEGMLPVKEMDSKILLATPLLSALTQKMAVPTKDKNTKAENNTSGTDTELPKQIPASLLEKLPSSEKIVSTEDFLQMQTNARNPQKVLAQLKPEAVVSAGVAAELLTNTERKNNPSDIERKVNVSDGLDKNHHAAIADNIVPLPVANALTGAAAGIVMKDIYISSNSEAEQRAALMGHVTQNVRLQATSGGGEMRMIIHPEALGELTLKVGTKNGRVEVAVIAENEQVASMIRQNDRELREALGEHNLSLAKFEVSVVDTKSVINIADARSSLMDNNSFTQHSNSQQTAQQSGANLNNGNGAFQQRDGYSTRREAGYEANNMNQSQAKSTNSKTIKRGLVDVVA